MLVNKRESRLVRMIEMHLSWPSLGNRRLGQAIQSEINLNLFIR